MKNRPLIAAVLLLVPTLLVARIGDSCDSHENFAHSFMFTRPASSRIAVDQALWHNIIHDKNGSELSAVQCIVLLQKSTKPKPIARYFLFGGKNSLHVAGDMTSNDPQENINTQKQRDVRAEWLNLPSNFSGDMSLSPEQKQTMFSFSYNQDLRKFTNSKFFENSWVSIDLPIVIMESDIGLTQNNIINPGTQPADIIEAFRQSSWCYGKMRGKNSSVQLADLTFKLGRVYLAENNFEIAYYSIFNLPTGSEQDPTYLFDAFTGFNRHFGFGGGVNFQLVLNKNTEAFTLCWTFNLQSIFFARNTQIRTFDLCNKPWSRYMLFTHHDRGPGQAIPGVNVLSRRVRVRPYNMADFSTALRSKGEKLEWEIGYNIWGHGDEKIELKESCEGIFGILGASEEGDDCAVTASKSTIKTQASVDLDSNDARTFIAIKDTDLDLNSGAAQATMNHMFHASIGIIHKGERYDGFAGVGFFYEAPASNRDMTVLGGWAKCGASF